MTRRSATSGASGRRSRGPFASSSSSPRFLTVATIVLREPVTAAFYQYGAFTADASARTASALAFFAIGLAGHIVVHVLTRAFYAMQDTRTPVAWAVVAVAINVPLMALLVDPMGIEGLALALSIASVIEVIGLLWSLHRRIESIEAPAIAAAVVRAADRRRGCGARHVRRAAGARVGGARRGRSIRWGASASCCSCSRPAALAYLAAARVARSPELSQLRRGDLRLRRRGA